MSSRPPSERLAGRLASLRNLTSDRAALSTFAFTRDPNGNITRSLREDGSCWYYAYDGLERLTGAHWKASDGSSLYAYEYAYDKAGNRLHIVENGTPTYYSYNAANEVLHEVTPGGEIAYYTFDGRGNQTQRKVLGGPTHYLEYNSRNLITAIASTDPAFTPNYFTYNALGQRITKTDSTGFTRYVWDGLDILLELDSSENVTRRYTHGYSPIEGVSSLISVQDELGCPCFYHFDQVGGVRQLTDRWQNPIKAYAYEPFGRLLAESGNAANEFVFPANTVSVADCSQRRLGYLRGYCPALGSWGSRDVLRSLNRYRFLLGNPLRLVDPDTRGVTTTDPPATLPAPTPPWVPPRPMQAPLPGSGAASVAPSLPAVSRAPSVISRILSRSGGAAVLVFAMQGSAGQGEMEDIERAEETRRRSQCRTDELYRRFAHCATTREQRYEEISESQARERIRRICQASYGHRRVVTTGLPQQASDGPCSPELVDFVGGHITFVTDDFARCRVGSVAWCQCCEDTAQGPVIKLVFRVFGHRRVP